MKFPWYYRLWAWLRGWEYDEHFGGRAIYPPTRGFKRAWLRRIWRHHFSKRPTKVPTRLSACLRASIGLVLGLIDDDADYTSDYEEVAWGNNGTYETDYGTGHSWETLGVRPRSFRVAFWEDGSL